MQGDSGSEIDVWVDRARRMVEYRAEAMDFLRRVGSMLPAAGTDVELVCRLWTAADEYDVTICEAVQRFDVAIFDVPGEIEITRGCRTRSDQRQRRGSSLPVHVDSRSFGSP